MTKIHIVDAPCGIGKTTAAINMINNASDDEGFIYITPFLSEVNRVKQACKNTEFIEPERKCKNGKTEIFYRLVKKKADIVTTHSVLNNISKSDFDSRMLNGYTMILDEVADVVDILSVDKSDKKDLDAFYITTNEEGELVWNENERNNYSGKYKAEKNLIEKKVCYYYNSEGNNRVIISFMNPEIFSMCKEVYVLTYLFNGQVQRSYFDFFGIDYDYLFVKDNMFVKEKQVYDIGKYKDLINVYENDKMNLVGEKKTALSVSWFSRDRNKEDVQRLKNHICNYFKNIIREPSENVIWTSLKEHRYKLRGNGYSSRFVPINSRSTNEYGHCTSIAYLSNRYANPIIKNFFASKGIDIDEDMFALSELIQFIFRSRIRNGEPINLYLPSIRMRVLLDQWLNNQSLNVTREEAERVAGHKIECRFN